MYDRSWLQNLGEKNVSVQVYCTMEPLSKVGTMTVKEIRKIMKASKNKN